MAPRDDKFANVCINFGTLILMLALGTAWGWVGAGVAFGIWAILMGVGLNILRKKEPQQ